MVSNRKGTTEVNIITEEGTGGGEKMTTPLSSTPQMPAAPWISKLMVSLLLIVTPV